MDALARWSLKVSRDTGAALRTLLAKRGGRKRDLSRFGEEAVNREVLCQTISDIRTRNADLDEDEVVGLIDQELGATRMTFWIDARR